MNDYRDKKRKKSLLKVSAKELHDRIIQENYGEPIAANMHPRSRARNHAGHTGSNHSEDKIARALDLKRNIEKIIKVFEKLDAGSLDAQTAIGEVGLDAFRQMTFFLYNEFTSEKTKLDAAKHLMGVAGMVPVQKHAVATVDASSEREQLLSIIAGSSKVLEQEGLEIIDDRDSDEDEPMIEVNLDETKAE